MVKKQTLFSVVSLKILQSRFTSAYIFFEKKEEYLILILNFNQDLGPIYTKRKSKSSAVLLSPSAGPGHRVIMHYSGGSSMIWRIWVQFWVGATFLFYSSPSILAGFGRKYRIMQKIEQVPG